MSQSSECCDEPGGDGEWNGHGRADVGVDPALPQQPDDNEGEEEQDGAARPGSVPRSGLDVGVRRSGAGDSRSVRVIAAGPDERRRSHGCGQHERGKACGERTAERAGLQGKELDVEHGSHDEECQPGGE